jgi:adenosine deaminase
MTRFMRRLLRGLGRVATILLILPPGFAAARITTVADPAAHVAALFEQVRGDPLRLRVFLAAMPKGADLHHHLDGAIYAESWLTRARSAGLCIEIAALAIRRPPCTARQPRADQAFGDQPGLEDAMIDSLSMRDFFPRPGDASGHDHFFATFGKFSAAQDDPAANLTEVARRAAAEHVDYIETMWTPHLHDAIRLVAAADWYGDDFARDLAPIEGSIAQVVVQARQTIDAAEAQMRTTLGCATQTPEPACQVTIRYLPISLRTFEPKAVFAQIAFDFALAAADPRVVGVNIVAPEDDPVALRDYTLHMRMLRFLHQAHPSVRLSLHAGELAFGLVPPEALRFHIRQAVEIAGASRIGHGVSVMYEDDAAGLLAEMARRHVAVEINQTSNEQILGVHGAQHPFAEYRAAGVPVVISTDDAGVERTDLTQEYVRAAQTWHLGYRDLKQLSRDSIVYSFLPDAEKTRMERRLDQEFAVFEMRMAHRAW